MEANAVAPSLSQHCMWPSTQNVCVCVCVFIPSTQGFLPAFILNGSSQFWYLLKTKSLWFMVKECNWHLDVSYLGEHGHQGWCPQSGAETQRFEATLYIRIQGRSQYSFFTLVTGFAIIEWQLEEVAWDTCCLIEIHRQNSNQHESPI